MMKNKKLLTLAAISIVVSLATAANAATKQHKLTRIQELGKNLFFDAKLSSPAGQACATCHGPTVGYTGPDEIINVGGAVYEGAVAGRFGNRKPPAAAYAGDSPILHVEAGTGLFVGGMFWDGRATGWTLGDPLAEQAQGPFLNPAEQNGASPAEVVGKVAQSCYARLFEQVWGCGALSLDATNVPVAYERIARSIAAYERSKEVSAFTSKYDAYLEKKAKLTRLERQGLQLFEGKGQCAACHTSTPGQCGPPPLFTDFTYDNLGIPKNPANPFYDMPYNSDGTNWLDFGFGGFLASVPDYATNAAANVGKHKVPTLRNVDKRPYSGFIKAYGHNGYFKSLKEIVHFYNTRDVLAANWPPPEIPMNLNTAQVGNLGLTDHEEDAIVAFLGTLTDGYDPRERQRDHRDRD